MIKNKPAHNTGFASGGVRCKLGALCFYLSAVLADSFVLRPPNIKPEADTSALLQNGGRTCLVFFYSLTCAH